VARPGIALCLGTGMRGSREMSGLRLDSANASGTPPGMFHGMRMRSSPPAMKAIEAEIELRASSL